MNKRIEVGDLVVIVRGHDCILRCWAGVPFRVEEIRQPVSGGWRCSMCGRDLMGPNEPSAGPFHRGYVPISWLKRIPPLTDLERQDEREKVSA